MMTKWLGLPTLASEHGQQMDVFMFIVHVIMLVAFVGWGAWFAYALVRFRSSKNPTADYKGMRTRVPYVFVALMALSEFALLIGMALPFWHDEIDAAPMDDADAFRVRVIGQQFQWHIHYPGLDGVFGRTDIELIDDQVNPLGLDKDDPNSEDDIVAGQLHLPVNEQVLIHLGTKDMIHSFALPEFRIKQDAIPGMSIPVYFTPTMTTVEFREVVGNPERDFEIACAQLCGVSHYTMRGTLIVETMDEFNAWYEAELEEKRLYAEDDDWFD